METMKAISIRQPWAWLVATGQKDIENRTWATSFRGRILIHASKDMTRREYEDVEDFLHWSGIGVRQAITLPPMRELARGGIVGVATLDNVVAPSARTSPWHIEGCQGFHLSNARPLPLTACKGALGVFNVDPQVYRALHDQHAPLLLAA